MWPSFFKLMGSIHSRHNFSEFVKPVSSKGISIEDIHLSSDDLEMYIDLAPFLNPSPYVVPEDMSLTKVLVFFPPLLIYLFHSFVFIISSNKNCILFMVQVYNLFRQLGLRHIFVVPRASRVVGMITRKDLLIEVCANGICFSVVFNFSGLYNNWKLCSVLQDSEDSANVELQSTSVRSLCCFSCVIFVSYYTCVKN